MPYVRSSCVQSDGEYAQMPQHKAITTTLRYHRYLNTKPLPLHLDTLESQPIPIANLRQVVNTCPVLQHYKSKMKINHLWASII